MTEFEMGSLAVTGLATLGIWGGMVAMVRVNKDRGEAAMADRQAAAPGSVT